MGQAVKSVRLAPRAEKDLNDLAAYIAQRNPERAYSYAGEILRACETIGFAPTAYAKRSEIAPGLRMAGHPPYVIFFRILKTHVRVERIIHGARDMRRAYRSR
jgi:plasmid stabilization system protein ParE